MVKTVIDLPTPHVLRAVQEYEAAVAEIDRLLDLHPAPLSQESDRLELLAVLVEDYEARTNPIDDSDLSPQDIVDFMLEQKGMQRGDLADLFGGRSRVSEFFSGKRELSNPRSTACAAPLESPPIC